MILHYDFNKNLTDKSINGYDGEDFGNLIYSKGIEQEGLKIGNTSSDYVSIPMNEELEDFTISFFAKLNSVKNRDSNTVISVANEDSTNAFIVYYERASYKGGWRVDIAGDVLKFRNKNKTDDNKFHHIVISREGNQGTLYIDGVKNDSGTISTKTIQLVDSSVLIGQEQDAIGEDLDKNQALNGVVDEFRIYERALESSEIDDIFNNVKYGELLYKLMQDTNKEEFEKTSEWYDRIDKWEYFIDRKIKYESYDSDREKLVISFDLSDLGIEEKKNSFYNISTDEASEFYKKGAITEATFRILAKPNKDKKTVTFYLDFDNIELDDLIIDDNSNNLDIKDKEEVKEKIKEKEEIKEDIKEKEDVKIILIKEEEKEVKKEVKEEVEVEIDAESLTSKKDDNSKEISKEYVKTFETVNVTSLTDDVKTDDIITTTALNKIDEVKNKAVKSLLGKQEINGYFIHYGTGAYDWAYIPPNKAYVAKLEGMKGDGNLDWNLLHSANKQAFKTIDISSNGKTVTFGALSQDLPGSNTALNILANTTAIIDGYFIHYDKSAYDWAYIPPSKAYVVKLEGMKENGNLDWKTLHSSKETAFDIIDISTDGKYITFVNRDTKVLPGQ